MDIEQIKSEADYDAALVEIDHLMGASPDTLEGRKLETLLTPVFAYEDARWPIDHDDRCGQPVSDDPDPDTS